MSLLIIKDNVLVFVLSVKYLDRRDKGKKRWLCRVKWVCGGSKLTWIKGNDIL